MGTNTFVVPQWVSMETLRLIINKSQIAPFFNTDYNKEFKKEFAVGESVKVKLPQKFKIRDGMQYDQQPISRRYTDVTIDQPFGIDFGWDGLEQALKLEHGEDQIRAEYLEPAATQMASEIDSRCALWAYQNTNNVVGVLGTTPTTLAFAGTARTLLNENACTPGERGMIITPSMEEASVNASTTVFNPTNEISRQYKEGSMGRAKGFDWYSSNSLYDHTAGTWAGAVTVTSGGQSGTQILITATAGDTFKKGDVISMGSAGTAVNNVNPVTRRSTGRIKTVVVTQDLTAAGGGADVLNISPGLDGPGSQYQNVSQLPAAGCALTLWPGTNTPNGLHGMQGLAMNKDAFGLVGVSLQNPKASSFEIASSMRDPASGLWIGFIRAFDFDTRSWKNRLDTVMGFGNFYPDNCAVRVASLT